MRVPKMAQISSSWCQSLEERARRDISTPKIIPTWFKLTSETSRLKPILPSELAPDLPRSSSMTKTLSLGQPINCARATRPYCKRVDSWWSKTCWAVDCLT
jgi:hypothetical protein